MKQGLTLVSDIHGCALTLQALLAKCPKDRQVVLLGDLIDRGKRSRQVVEWAMANRIPTCLGNHEHLVVDYHLNQLVGEKSDYADGIWLMNGGIGCLYSWHGKAFTHDSKLPGAVVAWMAALPLNITFPEYPDLLLSHTGHVPIAEPSLSPFDAVWDRRDQFPDDGLTRVYGHTPVKSVDPTGRAICIDTGCAYGGRLTALLWPERTVVDQLNVD